MKILEGIITSIKMNKTVVVEVSYRKPHPLYKKMIKKNKKFKADSGSLTLKIGDKVKMIETRPISTDKYFKVMEPAKKKGEQK